MTIYIHSHTCTILKLFIQATAKSPVLCETSFLTLQHPAAKPYRCLAAWGATILRKVISSRLKTDTACGSSVQVEVTQPVEKHNEHQWTTNQITFQEFSNQVPPQDSFTLYCAATWQGSQGVLLWNCMATLPLDGESRKHLTLEGIACDILWCILRYINADV